MLPIWFAPLAVAVAMIRATQALTRRPFAVNIRADLAMDDRIGAATDLGVGVVHLFWGDSGGLDARDPSRRCADDRHRQRRRNDATGAGGWGGGADRPGGGSGGHVLGAMPLETLLPLVVEMAGEVPVAAAGGLSDAEDVARVLALGASAAFLGTRFVACEESDAHGAYRQALIAARPEDTVRTLCFDGGWPDAPHRVLHNSTFRAWEQAGSPPPGARPGEGDIVMRDAVGTANPRYHCAPPHRTMTGELEAAALYAGTGVGKIADVRPAGVLIDEIMQGLPSSVTPAGAA